MRTSPFLMIYFDAKGLVVENYFTKRSFRGTLDTLLLLAHFSKWGTLDRASKALREYSQESMNDSVANLVQNRLLISEGSVEDNLDNGFSEKWLWPIPSRYYHLATRLDGPVTSREQIRTFYERYLKGKKQPPLYKDYPAATKIKLPRFLGEEGPLFKTMLQRRTTRDFSGGSISLRQLSRILFFTWGRLSTYDTKEFGKLLHKASPSAGARHPIEAYAVINNVEGMGSGIYHYSVREHALELLRSGDFRKKCVDFAAGQEWTRNTSALFIMTAIVARTAWKYRIPRVYRAFLLDVGHLSQSFLLVSTALKLGAFCIGIISDTAIEKELGLDGINEVALFAVGVGRPAKPTRE